MITLGITPLGWAIIIMSVFVGTSIGYYIFKRFPNLFNHDRKMKKIIKNPHLLMEKLKAHGKIYDGTDDGRRQEIDFKVGLDKESGKETLIEERKEPVKIREIKKKVVEGKTKSKKKKKKHGKRKSN